MSKSFFGMILFLTKSDTTIVYTYVSTVRMLQTSLCPHAQTWWDLMYWHIYIQPNVPHIKNACENRGRQ